MIDHSQNLLNVYNKLFLPLHTLLSDIKEPKLKSYLRVNKEVKDPGLFLIKIKALQDEI